MTNKDEVGCGYVAPTFGFLVAERLFHTLDLSHRPTWFPPPTLVVVKA